MIPGFTSRYNLTRLVYCEAIVGPDAAITREEEIKGWRGEEKIRLIQSMNPRWDDLAENWQDLYKPELAASGSEILAPLEKARGFGMTRGRSDPDAPCSWRRFPASR